MIVDASALLSILFEEADGTKFKQYLATAPGGLTPCRQSTISKPQ